MFAILALVLLLLTIPWLIHVFAPRHPLEVVVLNKTAPFTDRIEHRSFFWVLEHLKVVHADGRGYDWRTDYLGTQPGPDPGDPPAATRDLTESDIEGAQLLYLIDTYGVYEEDLASGARMAAALERSGKIYGGLTSDEADVARRAALDGVSVIAEWNTFASPTGGSARAAMEELLGVKWTHWIGRHFRDLGDEGDVPGWIRRNYEREWGKPWEFNGRGYVLLRGDDAVEVLQPGKHTERIGLTVERTDPIDPLLADARDGVPYSYWFDIVDVAEETKVLARFKWHLHDLGAERLRERGLPRTFAAVTRNRSRIDEFPAAARFYFAGDFSDSTLGRVGVPFAGYPGLRGAMERARLLPSEETFFWRFYVPMMRRMLVDGMYRL